MQQGILLNYNLGKKIRSICKLVYFEEKEILQV